MDLVLKRRIEGVGIWLSVEEAIQTVRNAKRLQAEIASMLSGGGIDPRSGQEKASALEGGVAPVGLAVLPALRPGTLNQDVAKKAYRRPGSKPRGEKATCRYCGKVLASYMLSRHIQAKHGGR